MQNDCLADRLRPVLTAVLALLVGACGGSPVSPTPATGSVSGVAFVSEGTASAARLGEAELPGRAGTPGPRNLPTYVPGQLLIKLRPGVLQSQAESLHRAVGGRVALTIPRINVQVVRLPQGVSETAALAAYRSSGLVEYAEQDVYVYANADPNDPYYPRQWHYRSIGLPAAWDVVIGSPVIVAVLDSGIRFDHPDLGGVASGGYDFVDSDPDPTDPGCPEEHIKSGHGVFVAGIVAAATDNGIGVAGVVWGGRSGIRIMPVRVLDGCCIGTVSTVAAGIVYAADNGAKVINMSLGGPQGARTLEDAVNYAYGRGVVLVAAAGNQNGPVNYPAAYPNVIAVAATACNNAKASYSNYGPEVDLAAPGGDDVDCDGDGRAELVLSTWWTPVLGNTYARAKGTSASAPHVSGAAALLIARGIVGPEAIRERLQSTAVDLGPPGRDDHYGWGLVDAARAVGASSPATAMRAFVGTLNGSSIARQSDVAAVGASGAFVITNAEPGTRSVFVWQDFNGNGSVDLNDYYGKVDGVVIERGRMTSGVNVVVRRYVGPPVTVSP